MVLQKQKQVTKHKHSTHGSWAFTIGHGSGNECICLVSFQIGTSDHDTNNKPRYIL